jgi:acetyl esterase
VKPSDELTRLALLAAMRLPERMQRTAASGHGVGEDGTTVAPDLAMLLRALKVSTAPSLHELTPEEARQQFTRRAALRRGRAQVPCRTLDLHVPAGDKHLRARLYFGSGDQPSRALMVYFHGGAMVVGDLDSEDYALRMIATNAQVEILSVQYPLAPEHPFPAAIHDAMSVTLSARRVTERWGVRGDRLLVAGSSAGGNLAAVTAQRWRESGDIPLAGQLLLYPSLDRHTANESRRIFADGFLLDQREMAWAAEHYLPSRTPLDHPWLAPGLVPDLSRLPPSIVATSGADPLRDEGVQYAERLGAEAQSVTHLDFADQVHGFMNLAPLVPPSRNAVLTISEAVSRLVAPDQSQACA